MNRWLTSIFIPTGAAALALVGSVGLYFVAMLRQKLMPNLKNIGISLVNYPHHSPAQLDPALEGQFERELADAIGSKSTGPLFRTLFTARLTDHIHKVPFGACHCKSA